MNARENAVLDRADSARVLIREGLACRGSCPSVHARSADARPPDRGWILAGQIKDVGSGVNEGGGRQALLKASRRCEIDIVAVWRLDRWGRSVADLMTTIRDLTDLGVGFVITDRGPRPDHGWRPRDGRYVGGLRRIRARDSARASSRRDFSSVPGSSPSRPPRTSSWKSAEGLRLKAEFLSRSEIARRLGIGRTSVRQVPGSPVRQFGLEGPRYSLLRHERPRSLSNAVPNQQRC